MSDHIDTDPAEVNTPLPQEIGIIQSLDRRSPAPKESRERILKTLEEWIQIRGGEGGISLTEVSAAIKREKEPSTSASEHPDSTADRPFHCDKCSTRTIACDAGHSDIYQLSREPLVWPIELEDWIFGFIETVFYHRPIDVVSMAEIAWIIKTGKEEVSLPPALVQQHPDLTAQKPYHCLKCFPMYLRPVEEEARKDAETKSDGDAVYETEEEAGKEAKSIRDRKRRKTFRG
ncbi:hypothetical protein FPOAC1_010385 [Fusarium poae]|uniref:hypothetical protein n=1 Tax=Fusarium poae TaxID=36050 RepID=UPI001CEACCD0|nr:hypothetical protein FPOAC1_010385 [Fusarium poae]KAG8665586.1 hypothetical protein FPOAC1_010385 [Fusarium poae]